jgi:hypothetical protein
VVGPRIDPQLHGKWELVVITNGLTQVRVQGSGLPYSEVLHFGVKIYAISRDGHTLEAALAFTERNTSHADFKLAIMYEKGQSYQPSTITDGRLFLYQRALQGSGVADGDTLEYKRQ